MIGNANRRTTLLQTFQMIRILFLLFLSSFITMMHAQTSQVMPLWPDSVPLSTLPKADAEGKLDTRDHVYRINQVSDPKLFKINPETSSNNKAILVCPGGGYQLLAYNLEGTEIAEWFTNLGFTAYVLQYRVPNNPEGALLDARRALELIRKDASYSQVGMIGFSAGAHLTMHTAATDTSAYRPNFNMLIYPAYMDRGENHTLSPELSLGKHVGPSFIFQTMDDPYGNSALVLAQALRAQQISTELHMLQRGGHGYGLRKGNEAGEEWPILAEQWLMQLFSK